jgi:hypothetical protein
MTIAHVSNRKHSPISRWRPTDLGSSWNLILFITLMCAVNNVHAENPQAAKTDESSLLHPELQRDLAAHFPAVDKPREVPAQAAAIGKGDFSLALWMKSDEFSDRQPGDLVSQYDSVKRRGFHLTLKSNPGVTSNQANWRHLQFGIDDNHESAWRDCGRPGRALFAFSLATHEGSLYAGTCEPGKVESGRVYRYDSDNAWIDCGAPDKSNSVTSLAVFQGKLYAGTGKYRLAGSSLPESENQNPGGRIFRYDGDRKWVDCGQLPDVEAVGGLVIFRGKLHASSLYRPAGFFRYEEGTRWTKLPVPELPDAQTGGQIPKRVVSLTVFEGFLYASSYDGGHVYRYDGQNWTDCGQVGDNTQTYSFAPFRGHLHVATWRSGRVFRFEEVGRWTDIGRLGEELEVMGMLVHNGRFIAGTLPLAQVYSYEGETNWKLLQRLDHTPDVTYRRAWTMAEHAGQVFCSTLPSGKIYAFSAGQQTQWGQTLSSDWHHICAVKSADRLTLYVDGRQVSQSATFGAARYQLDSNAPLQLGTGLNGPCNGQLEDVRIYRRVLTATEIESLAKSRPSTQ